VSGAIFVATSTSNKVAVLRTLPEMEMMLEMRMMPAASQDVTHL